MAIFEVIMVGIGIVVGLIVLVVLIAFFGGTGQGVRADGKRER